MGTVFKFDQFELKRRQRCGNLYHFGLCNVFVCIGPFDVGRVKLMFYAKSIEILCYFRMMEIDNILGLGATFVDIYS